MQADGSRLQAYGIDAYYRLMESGELQGMYRYNKLTGHDEINRSDEPEESPKWDAFVDSDLSRLRYYFENQYGLNNRADLDDALRVVFSNHTIDPVTELLDTLQWDGQSRITRFLIDKMGAENTEYSAECSRLIFAGGVHRAYEPGCKFDDMVVLVGTQGGGKSTVVRLLNICDDWYKEATTVDGKEGVEAISGGWIVEFSEMMAMTSIKEVEGVKAFVTRQVDHLRKAYGRYESDMPRHCIFIGTTNNDRFLTDKTGNRRFYPVTIHTDGYDLYDHEQELREYIRQCWAEAVYLYKRGDIPACASRSLRDTFRAHQEEAREDDWREGMINQFLENKKPGDLTCIIEIFVECLSERPEQKPDRKDSIDIAKIIGQNADWTLVGTRKVGQYGKQKAYMKRKNAPEPVETPVDMPF